MCLMLKEADSAPVPDKCPSVDKADWLICLLQTKYENVSKSYGAIDRYNGNVNDGVETNVQWLILNVHTSGKTNFKYFSYRFRA